MAWPGLRCYLPTTMRSELIVSGSDVGADGSGQAKLCCNRALASHWVTMGNANSTVLIPKVAVDNIRLCQLRGTRLSFSPHS